MSFKFKVEDSESGLRVDKFLSSKLPQFSRSLLQKMFKNGLCLVNGVAVKKNAVLRHLDQVLARDPSNVAVRAELPHLELKFICEDPDYLVLDKPAGIVVHGKDSLCDYLPKFLSNDFVDSERPGIVHRLDKWTSGCLLVARNQNALEYFQKQFKGRTVRKIYIALVRGILQYKKGVVDSPIGRDLRSRKRMAISSEGTGKKAISKFRVMSEFDSNSLVEIELLTGRTHQVRVHMQAIGHPVIGDELYGDKKLNAHFEAEFGLKRQFLHAHVLEFQDLKKKPVRAVSELAGDLQGVLDKISV